MTDFQGVDVATVSHASRVNTLSDLTPSLIDRFRSKVRLDDPSTSCHAWLGEVGKGGYGRITCVVPGHGRTKTGAHRIAYILAHGSIPVGMVIDHVCRNRVCVNSDHLEAVTNAENIQRGEVGHYERTDAHLEAMRRNIAKASEVLATARRRDGHEPNRHGPLSAQSEAAARQGAG